VLFCRSWGTQCFSRGWICPRNLAHLQLLLLRCTASERRREGDAWRSKVGGDHPPRCSFGCSLRLLPLQFLLRVSAALIIGGMWFLTLRQLTVTANWSGGSVFLLRTFFLQLAARAPQTSGRLPTVCPKVAEVLAVVALCKAVLSPVSLQLDCYVAEGCQPEDFLRLCRSRQGDEEKGEDFW
jgi:hypothetical protein